LKIICLFKSDVVTLPKAEFGKPMHKTKVL